MVGGGSTTLFHDFTVTDVNYSVPTPHKWHGTCLSGAVVNAGYFPILDLEEEGTGNPGEQIEMIAFWVLQTGHDFGIPVYFFAPCGGCVLESKV